MRHFRTLAAFVMVLILIGVASPAFHTGAQDAPMAATPAAQPPVLEELVAAWNAHDPQRVAALYTEDAVVEVGFAGEIIAEGRDAIANEFVAANLAAIPDWQFETRAAYEAGDYLIWEWTYTGTYTGQFEGAPPGTGQPVSLRGVTIFELRDGLIARDIFYDDYFAFLEQLGLLPVAEAAEEAGTPVS